MSMETIGDRCEGSAAADRWRKEQDGQVDTVGAPTPQRRGGRARGGAGRQNVVDEQHPRRSSVGCASLECVAHVAFTCRAPRSRLAYGRTDAPQAAVVVWQPESACQGPRQPRRLVESAFAEAGGVERDRDDAVVAADAAARVAREYGGEPPSRETVPAVFEAPQRRCQWRRLGLRGQIQGARVDSPDLVARCGCHQGGTVCQRAGPGACTTDVVDRRTPAGDALTGVSARAFKQRLGQQWHGDTHPFG